MKNLTQEQIDLNKQTDEIINVRLCEIIRNEIIMNKEFIKVLNEKITKLIKDEIKEKLNDMF